MKNLEQRVNDIFKKALEEASSPWTSSGKHPEDMSREELQHEIDIFKQYEKMGMSLSPREIMRMDSLYDYLDTVDEGYKVLPDIDKERYTEMPGLEGPFQTMSGKPIYYDPKEGAYYDRDTDMYLTYDEFKALDDDYKGMNEGEAGDHDRMYKVVHVKKGMMDIKAKTSYEAAKKFAKEKGLKSTAGVDTHLYPLEEAKLDKNFFRNIASMDQPHDEIERLLTADGPEGDVIRREYEITAGENGLHPDDDFEEVLDMMVHDFEDMTFENMHPMVAPPNKNPKFKSNMPIKPPNKNPRINTDFYKRMQKSFQQQGQEKPWWMREGENKMGPQEIMPGDRVEHEGDMYQVVAVDGDILTVNNLQNGNETKFKMDDVTRLFGTDAMTDQDKDDLEAMFKRLKKAGSGSLKHTATEGHSPHKKGTKKYKAHMAAMHANSVDLNAMRDALKLDESTDANTIVAQYTRATLDQRHDTWGKVCNQIDHIRSFVKEDVDVENVRLQIRKMHEQEGLDNKILVKENVNKLRQIVKDKSAMSIKFADGSMKVDMTTANIFLQMYDRMKERNQKKIDDMMQTKAGFLKVLDFFYGAMK